MDPLSIPASSLAIASFGLQLVDTAQRLRELYERVQDAPDYVRKLVDDTTILQALFDQCAVTHAAIGGGQPETAAIQRAGFRALENCKRVTDDLAALLKKLDNKLSSKSGRRRKWGALETAFSKPAILEIQINVENAKSTLLLFQQLSIAHRMLVVTPSPRSGESSY